MVPWKKSATVIALVRNVINKPNICSNYEIVIQKRSNKSAFYPNAVVFPGGAYENFDSSEDWLDHFNSFGINQDRFKKFHNQNAPAPPILRDGNDIIKNHVALRITAIRETFEELGILICRNRNETAKPKSSFASHIENYEVLPWQKKVHDDPVEFLNLCKSLDCYPDIFSLHLWSNWLTPVRIGSKRYDSLFFLTALESKPEVYIQQKEVASYQWSTPADIIRNFENRELFLAPPQWYELTRLSHQKDFDSLMSFAEARSAYGAELFFPMYQKAKNGNVVILPGDELYPQDPDFYNDTQVVPPDSTIESINDSSQIKHRMIRRKENYDMISLMLENQQMPCHHVSPLGGKVPIISNKSHL